MEGIQLILKQIEMENSLITLRNFILHSSHWYSRLPGNSRIQGERPIRITWELHIGQVWLVATIARLSHRNHGGWNAGTRISQIVKPIQIRPYGSPSQNAGGRQPPEQRGYSLELFYSLEGPVFC